MWEEKQLLPRYVGDMRYNDRGYRNNNPWAISNWGRNVAGIKRAAQAIPAVAAAVGFNRLWTKESKVRHSRQGYSKKSYTRYWNNKKRHSGMSPFQSVRYKRNKVLQLVKTRDGKIRTVIAKKGYAPIWKNARKSKSKMRVRGYRKRARKMFRSRSRRARYKKAKKRMTKIIRKVSNTSPKCVYNTLTPYTLTTNDNECAYLHFTFMTSSDCNGLMSGHGPYKTIADNSRNTRLVSEYEATNRPYTSAKLRPVPVAHMLIHIRNNDNVDAYLQIHEFLCVDFTNQTPMDMNEDKIQQKEHTAAGFTTDILYNMSSCVQYVRGKWKLLKKIKSIKLTPGKEFKYLCKPGRATFDSFKLSRTGNGDYYKFLTKIVSVRLQGGLAHESDDVTDVCYGTVQVDIAVKRSYHYVIENPFFDGDWDQNNGMDDIDDNKQAQVGPEVEAAAPI